jgi:murein peptide amidase A
VVETGDFDSPRKVLVVGCIHGNECAATAVAQQLLLGTPSPADMDLWVVPNLNPDGYALARRGNARGVDLNRNFPWHWQHLQGIFKSGPRPLSEPETRIAYRLVQRIRPTVSIWFHQQLDLVDDSVGSLEVEVRFAILAGLGLTPLASEPGSVVTWENHCFPQGSAFVVELPAGQVDEVGARLLSAAVLGAAQAAPPVRPALLAACRVTAPLSERALERGSGRAPAPS